MEEIRLYCRTTADLGDPAVFDSYFERMPRMRQEKILRIRNQEDRKRSLAAGILLCHGLADFGVDGSRVCIETEVYGRPWLPDFPDIHFSLSHSGDMALAVFSRCEVGCDIEELKKTNLKVAKRFFCPEELEWILQGKEEDRDERFCRLWVLKESFLKVTGRGISLPMDEFCFFFTPAPHVRQNFDAARYTFEEYRYGELRRCAPFIESRTAASRNRCANPVIRIRRCAPFIESCTAASDKPYYAAVCFRCPDNE